MRAFLYLAARIVGDVNALLRGRLPQRAVNKIVGRKVVSKVWWKW